MDEHHMCVDGQMDRLDRGMEGVIELETVREGKEVHYLFSEESKVWQPSQ